MKDKVERIVREFINEKPDRITLKLHWKERKSDIELKFGRNTVVITLLGTISFSQFAAGVLKVYEESYGKLNVVPLSFREEIYKNDKVSLHLYPTGSIGRFDIFINYY